MQLDAGFLQFTDTGVQTWNSGAKGQIPDQSKTASNMPTT